MVSSRSRGPRATLRLLPLLALAATVALPPAAAAPLPAAMAAAPGGSSCHVAGVPRVVAVGDVHGAYERFFGILRAAGIIDDEGTWAGGSAHLVQLGDVLDRGRDTRRSLDLLMRLEQEAAKAGGRVHALLGNHEVMNLTGDLRYVNPDEYRDYVGADSEENRERFFRSAVGRARAAARQQGAELDEAAFRSDFLARTPLGFVERTQAFSSGGVYGRWLRNHRAVVEIDNVVFVHGGLTPELAALGCEAINDAVHRELTSDLSRTLRSPARTLVAGENGPLWFRGLASGDEAAALPAVEKTLAAMKARAIVVGHTVDASGRIEQRFGGRVLTIDTGMTDVYGAHAAALEITREGALTAIYPGSREPLASPVALPLAAGRPGE